MAAVLKYLDGTKNADGSEFVASTYTFTDEKAVGSAYDDGVKRIKDKKNHELHQTVVLEVDGKEAKRYPSKKTDD